MNDPFESYFPKSEPVAQPPIEKRLSLGTLSKYNKTKKKIQRLGLNELVYPVFKYLDEDVPPSIMFIPSKVMQFKLMMLAWIHDQARGPSE